MDQTSVFDACYRGNSVELFFDATNPSYLQVISDHLLPVFDEYLRRGVAVAGWVSVRFTGQSQAMLAMQRWQRTAALEVAVLRGITGSVELLRKLEEIAMWHGALVH